MPAQTQVASDIIGLVKAAPVSRRSFMSTSAAAAAGYTLAAGPVCAEAIKTSIDGLSAGGAKVNVADGDDQPPLSGPVGMLVHGASVG